MKPLHTAVVFLLASTLLLWVLTSALSIPIKVVAYPFGDCLRIIPAEAGTCAAPPRRYTVEYAKES